MHSHELYASHILRPDFKERHACKIIPDTSLGKIRDTPEPREHHVVRSCEQSGNKHGSRTFFSKTVASHTQWGGAVRAYAHGGTDHTPSIAALHRLNALGYRQAGSEL